MNQQIISLAKKDEIYYGTDDLTGYGHPLYVDSYYHPDRKPIEGYSVNVPKIRWHMK